LVTVQASDTIADALTNAAGSPHTRFPVIGDGDDIVGIVTMRDLFRRSRQDDPGTVADVARPVLDVAEVATVPTLWRRLRDDDQHCAMVVNEFGSVVGMVTLEDAVEEIFGELLDEFDREQGPVTVAGGRVTARGDVLLIALADRFGFARPAADVDTVGGLVWHELGRRPRVGDEVPVPGADVILRVEAMEQTSVTSVSFALPEGAK
jgi:CBS domain containing-hemolysin-like protein